MRPRQSQCDTIASPLSPPVSHAVDCISVTWPPATPVALSNVGVRLICRTCRRLSTRSVTLRPPLRVLLCPRGVFGIRPARATRIPVSRSSHPTGYATISPAEASIVSFSCHLSHGCRVARRCVDRGARTIILRHHYFSLTTRFQEARLCREPTHVMALTELSDSLQNALCNRETQRAGLNAGRCSGCLGNTLVPSEMAGPLNGPEHWLFR